MMPVVTTPPPVTSPKTQTATIRQSKTTKARMDAVGGVFQLAGFGFMVTGNLADSAAISRHAEPIATEIVKLAENDAKIASVIDKLANIGPYGALISAAIPLVAQLLVNHNRLAPGPAVSQMGVVPKATLEAEMRTAMAQAELHAQLVQQEAEEQLARVKAQMAESANGQASGGQ